MFKRKRKEKLKNGNSTKWLLLLAVLLVLFLGGVVTYVLFVPAQVAANNVIADESNVVVAGSNASDCSYSAGFGSRENMELSQTVFNGLEAAELDITYVTIEDDLREYRNCGDSIEALYDTCSTLTIATPINDNDPSEGELGREIASILDVLIAENLCTPDIINIIFETPTSGSITWQMTYELALEAYEAGARGIELYDPNARR